MVEYSGAKLDRVFHALSDPTRRSIIGQLANGEQSIGQIAAPFDISFAAASKHVRVLEKAGLVGRKIAGRNHFCSLQAGPLASAEAWLRHYERFWTQSLDRLEALIEEEQRQAQEGERR